MPRQPRLDSPGTLHHVIVRGIERRSIVDDDRDRGEFVSRMSEAASDTETKIHARALAGYRYGDARTPPCSKDSWPRTKD